MTPHGGWQDFAEALTNEKWKRDWEGDGETGIQGDFALWWMHGETCQE